MLLAILAIFFNSAAHSEGVKTPYTDIVQTLLGKDQPEASSFTLKCWTNETNDLYMGIEQRLKIHAPLAAVKTVVENVDEYDQLFPDYKKIKLVSKIENHLTIYFEQRVPLFFVPNIKYEMLYTILSPNPDKIFYWYQLKEKGTLQGSDGLIELKKIDAENTSYTEYDFFDADWGPAKLAGKNKLWSDVVEGIAISDLALARKAEDAKLSAEDAQKLAKKQIDSKQIEACVHDRMLWKN